MLRLLRRCPAGRRGQALDLPPGPGAPRPGAARAAGRCELLLFDGRGGEWLARVQAMGRQSVRVEVLSPRTPVDRELPWAVTLAVGMPANERMDWLVEKATELGAGRAAAAAVRTLGAAPGRRACRAQARALAGPGRGRCRAVRPHARAAGAAGAAPGRLAARTGGLPAAALAAQPAGRGAAPVRPARGSRAAGAERPRRRAVGRRRGRRPRRRLRAAVQLGPRVLRAETAPLAVLAWLALPMMNHADYLRHDATALAALVRQRRGQRRPSCWTWRWPRLRACSRRSMPWCG
jgi:16S rRNA (uracil1498-N3)-methyltransferase